jgi:ArsR family transcriptional regulator
MTASLDVEPLVRFYKALGDGTRLRLVALLAGLEPEQALCVNALVGRLGVSQPAVSQHLAVLRAADLVIGERRGPRVHYRLNSTGLEAYQRQASALLGESPAGALGRATPSQRRASARSTRRSRERA